jgi:hypothetical protein
MRQVCAIQLQAHKSKNPSANAGVFQFQMVARGGIDRGLTHRMLERTISKTPKNGVGWAMASVVSDKGNPY